MTFCLRLLDCEPYAKLSELGPKFRPPFRRRAQRLAVEPYLALVVGDRIIGLRKLA